MPEMLLINPRKRTRRKAVRKTAARRRNPIARVGKPSRARRAMNPVRAIRPRAMSAIRRRKNPVSLLRRRRRNPIKIGTTASGIMGMVKEALIGGAGSIGVDLAYGYIAPMLPASLQRTPGRVGVGDAVKAVATVLIGNVLSKPTRGLSVKMAKGALTVQATEILRGFVPATMRLGFSSPAPVINMSNRVGPNRVGAYVQPGLTPMLSAYQSGGRTPLLSASRNSTSAMRREGASTYR